MGAVGLLFVSYLVAHSLSQGERPTVFQFGHQLTFEYEEDVASFAPVVRAVTGGVLDDADAGVAGFDRVPDGSPGFSWFRLAGNCIPVGDAELCVLDQHDGIVPPPSPSPARGQNLENKGRRSQEQL